MYAPERAAFTLAGMLARNLLAIIDHNHHLHRPYSFDKDNNQRLSRVWSKRAKRWKVFLVICTLITSVDEIYQLFYEKLLKVGNVVT